MGRMDGTARRRMALAAGVVGLVSLVLARSTAGAEAFERIRLVRVGDRGFEVVVPATGDADVPGGIYSVWGEAEWMISPYARRLGSEAALGSRRLGYELAPAGRVVMPKGIEAPGMELRLLSLVEPRVQGVRMWPIELQRSATAGGPGALLPAGPALALLWDSKQGRAVAVSHPFEVVAERTIEVPLEVPKRAVVVATIGTSPGLSGPEEDPEVWLEIGGQRRMPSTVLRSARRLDALWYAVPSGPGELRADLPGSYVRHQLELGAGDIRTPVLMLREYSSLSVQVRRTGALDADMEVGLVEECSACRPLARGLELPRGESGVVIDGLFASRYLLRLVTPLGELVRSVEIAEGENRRIVLEPRVVRLTGTVTRAGAPVEADVVFTTIGEQRITTSSDEAGAYEVLCLQPVVAVRVTPRRRDVAGESGDAPLASFGCALDAEIAGSCRLDLELDRLRATSALGEALSRCNESPRRDGVD